MPQTARIAELEDELKQRDARILELKTEVDETRELVNRMREQVEDGNALINSWIEAFDMELDDSGAWVWTGSMKDVDLLVNKYEELRREWNKFILEYNAAIAPRSKGRPLHASEAQVAVVEKLHKDGESLRAIAAHTGLSFSTVRTIACKAAGTDAASKRTNLLRKGELDRARMNSWRARKRVRDGLPARINEHLKEGAVLVKAAKGLGG